MADKKKKTGFVSLPSYREQKKIDKCNQYAVFAGDVTDLKTLRIERIMICVLLIASVVAQGFMRITGMQTSMLVVFPYAVEVALTALFCVRSFSLVEKAERMNLVIYNKTADLVPALSAVLAILALIGALGSVLYISKNGFDDARIARIVYIAMKVFDIAICIVSFLLMKKYKWDMITQ